MTELQKFLRAPFILLLLLSVNIRAEDLFSLSLEELLQIKIASRKEQREVDAPSVVSVITAAEIQRFGARNLRDVIDRVVNTQIIGSNLYPHNRVSMRGVTQTHTDNKILLLLNGRVLRDGNQGGINSDIYNLFPLPMIRKIEIIRGPGSVIYGTNAFSGALNIITYDGNDDIDQVELNAGSFDSYGATLLLFGSGQNKGITVALNFQDIEGDQFDNILGEFNSIGTYPMDKEAVQLVSSGHYKDFEFNALYTDSSQGNVKSLFQFPASSLGIVRSHLALGYMPKLSDSLSLDLHVTHNYHEVDFDISNTRSTRTDSEDTIVELIGRDEINANFSILAGLVLERISGTIGNNTTTPNPFDYSTTGGFVQATWNYNDKNQITFGLQQNKPEDKRAKTSPRLAYIRNFNETWTFKSLYGQAFRSPFGTDMFLDSPSLQGNPDLKPEIIKTLDLQLIRKNKHSHNSLTYYLSKHSNLHNREIVNNVPTFVNSGEMRYQGIELESRHSLNDSFEIFANASFQKSKDEENTNIVTYNPEIMLKLGISYQNTHGLTYGLCENYFSVPALPENFENTVSVFNPSPESYHLVTLNIAMELQKHFNNDFFASTRLSLYIDNLLDQKIYFPNINRTDVNSIPHHAGRGIYLTLNKGF